jgi:vacuolar protein sorting-associated protein 13A/C
VDAGHIAIESDLASKEAIRIVHQKRNQKYDEDDYKQLESLMYDKLFLRLQDAQVSFVLYPYRSITIVIFIVHHRR